jgi:hypothetical protein
MQRRNLFYVIVSMPFLIGCASNRNREIQPTRIVSMTQHNNFDFFIGDWNVQHRRLVNRLVGSNDWQEFSGQCSARALMDGQGHMDDNVLNIPSGQYRAVTLRSYDPSTGLWAIWWLDSRRPHSLDIPVKGSFKNGVGTFLADDVFSDQPIKVRFLWLDTHTARPRWEQAFSTDAGATWETNWTMQFTRR